MSSRWRCWFATKEIKRLLQDSVPKVDEGTRFANGSGQVLNEIVIAAKKVTIVSRTLHSQTGHLAMMIGCYNVLSW